MLFTFQLAHRLSITETAKYLNMTQPTLSKHISQLENELHMQLFTRSHFGLRVTREGLELLNEAYNIIEAQDRLLQHAEFLQYNPLPTLVIGGESNDDAATICLGKAVTELSAQFGTSFIEITHNHDENNEEAVRNGEVDLCFDYIYVEDLVDYEDLDCILVTRMPWYAIVSPNNPLFMRESLTFEDLAGQTLIKMEGNRLCHAWTHVERYLKEHHIDVRYRRQYAMKSVDIVTLIASLNRDILLLGESFAQRLIASGNPRIKAIPLTDNIGYLHKSCFACLSGENESYYISSICLVVRTHHALLYLFALQ